MPRRPPQKKSLATTHDTQPAKDVNRTQRQMQALALRMQGYQWQEIADRCGIRGGKGAAYNLVNSALKAALRERTEDYRELMTQRLEALWVIQWQKATTERSDWAVDRLMAIHDRIERLHNVAIHPDASQNQAQMIVIGVPDAVLEAV